MKILLFNDNPVVQKLVALSAQKTKDELTVASSPEQIEQESCDLLIVDDALYSDEMFETIKEEVAFKNSLLMSTRGNAVPAGFDNVINKPFLPTDLVDTLIQIEKRIIAAASHEAPAAFAPEHENEESEAYSIDLEETLSEFEPGTEEDFAEDTAEESEMGLDLETLDVFEEGLPKTAILDHEEVQEVRELLEDTDSDTLEEDFGAVSGFEEEEIQDDTFDFSEPGQEEESKEEGTKEEEPFDFSALIEETKTESPEELVQEEDESEKEGAEEEEPFDFSALIEETGTESPEEPVQEAEESDELELKTEAEEEKFDFDEGMFAEEVHVPQHQEDVSDPFDFDMLGEEEFATEAAAGEYAEELALDEEEFDDLELKIQEAMEDLEPEDLDRELDEEMFAALETAEAEKEGVMFDELDLLDERELKLAIGEEVEPEPEVYVGDSGSASMAAEALGEVMGRAVQRNPQEEKTSELQGTPAEGVDALQALLKALANEDVAKSLKGLNITININFGNNA